MRSHLTWLFCFCWAISACAGQKLEVLKSIPHSGYSEGLDFHEGYLWYALPKEIGKIDPKDGKTMQRMKPATAYSESLKWCGGTLWNVSFSDNGIYKGGPGAWKRVGTTPENHAWGLECDGTHLILTGHYSKKLYFYDLKSVKQVRAIEVPISDLEDLAWDGTHLWSSSFTSHRGTIFRISPKDGSLLGQYELPDTDACPVIDGIAYDGQSLWITGKECPSLYRVKLPSDRAIAVK